MIRREIETIVRELAAGYPVVAITGPRQSGKTTLARHLFADKPYVSLENPDFSQLAEEDPRGLLARYREGAVLDEAQRSPKLFSFLQQVVDEDPRPGRFILTGSQQFGLMSRITQSLAGRVALVHLLPFTYRECQGMYDPGAFCALDEVLFSGLYPPVHDRHLSPPTWYANYTQTYVERDVRQMVNVRDLSSFQRFVRLCAGRTGQLVNLSGLASDAGITHNTARAWLSILEASYIVFLLQPHHRNFNKRLVKTSKLYFHDTGLLCWLLSIQSADQLNTHSMRGAVFENFVLSELLKARFNRGRPSDLYFWRDRGNNEVDVLIEHGDRLQPVEIKSGQTLNPDYFGGLKKWLALAGEAAVRPTLIYAGDQEAVHSGIAVCPWNRPSSESRL